ncbi:DUF5996 family protein [Methyloceanibacter caenitepidi]|uniref:Ava_C0101 and related proteins n=1 Tax=Methyloceanibacter caenitepidi TaxID=1384459 RepID=A0A0A8K0T5_9HYPH|nr:DUF5996 family protein [Methyloceanibacter caenitepidi]BAQ16122.1 Ava_C0101 and related proteins [Methyloceanibacter caenitepidi]
MTNANEAWPDLPYSAWRDTSATLHLWSQIVGKIRLVQSPWLNHSWHCTLYVTPRGLTTSTIPHGERTFDLTFDFVRHLLVVSSDDGVTKEIGLYPRTVADFYAAVMAALSELGLSVRIHEMPNEIPDAVPFSDDLTHAAYDPVYAERHWRALVQIDRVFKLFRSSFLGKSSPVHFFWGSFDMAVTRFSGRTAPLHPGGVPNLPDAVAQEAYSHEVASAGFWPGSPGVEYPAFYAYAYPEPEGYAEAPVGPDEAFYHQELKEFVLPYDAVRAAPDPDRALLDFLISTYEAAADGASWDRAALECPLGVPGKPRAV